MAERTRSSGPLMEGYVHRDTDHIDAAKLDIKLIALYAPQFYSDVSDSVSPEAGTRADEWFKVARGVPRYLGHY
jgi:hypothetical protein